eukprot:CAMPEP_0115221822 /NCGR_PEP_ID=MMETSP0270-20121206/28170_1 /TAXON_ID=71861 /ORGANISM="Scrippsiella trochoidea, Strain CCMP3099" /LENGTH=231 /DNA_ID=CAMNT_0002635939 /DNA_START=50 /DNA_END=743 /DNA_ORIENTATION=-
MALRVQMAAARHGRGLAVLVLMAVALYSLPATLSWCSPAGSLARPVGRDATRHIVRATPVSVGDADTTPLMLAAYKGDTEEVRGYAEGGAADLDAQDAYGWTALRYAVRAGHADAAMALIESGANIDLASNSGRTPLMSAAGNGLPEMVEMLIKAGADTKVENKAGETAFRISMRGGVLGCAECRKLLAEAIEMPRTSPRGYPGWTSEAAERRPDGPHIVSKQRPHLQDRQ